MHFSEDHTIVGAIKKIEQFCAYQERCPKEVEQKLRSFGMPPQAIGQIMAHLIKELYLSEERFAKSFARGKFNIKKWGKDRIVNELRLRDISRGNIQSALAEIPDDDYLDALDFLAHKRLAEIKEVHPEKRKKKLTDYLLYRGWESHLVHEKIMEVLQSLPS